MYVSGTWKGFWQQAGWGRQPMEQFILRFQDGCVTGRGSDCVGLFTIDGHYDTATGRIQWIKQYIGRHQVEYDGGPDGEGRIIGTWRIGALEGPFSLQPVVPDDLPIQEITGST